MGSESSMIIGPALKVRRKFEQIDHTIKVCDTPGCKNSGKQVSTPFCPICGKPPVDKTETETNELSWMEFQEGLYVDSQGNELDEPTGGHDVPSFGQVTDDGDNRSDDEYFYIAAGEYDVATRDEVSRYSDGADLFDPAQLLINGAQMVEKYADEIAIIEATYGPVELVYGAFFFSS